MPVWIRGQHFIPFHSATQFGAISGMAMAKWAFEVRWEQKGNCFGQAAAAPSKLVASDHGAPRVEGLWIDWAPGLAMAIEPPKCGLGPIVSAPCNPFTSRAKTRPMGQSTMSPPPPPKSPPIPATTFLASSPFQFPAGISSAHCRVPHHLPCPVRSSRTCRSVFRGCKCHGIGFDDFLVIKIPHF